jgi:hypothetical protein
MEKAQVVVRAMHDYSDSGIFENGLQNRRQVRTQRIQQISVRTSRKLNEAEPVGVAVKSRRFAVQGDAGPGPDSGEEFLEGGRVGD